MPINVTFFKKNFFFKVLAKLVGFYSREPYLPDCNHNFQSYDFSIIPK